MLAGFRAALSLSTIFPVRRPAQYDRALGARVVQTFPLVGLLLGVIAGLTAWVLQLLALPSFLSGVLLVGLLTFLTRGTHLRNLGRLLDGLTTSDSPEAALRAMRSSTVGYWSMLAMALALLAEIAAMGALISHKGAIFVGVIVAVSRWATPLLCMVKGSPIPRQGLASYLLGTQRPAFAWTLVVASAFMLAAGAAATAALSSVMPEVAVVLMVLYVALASKLTLYLRDRTIRIFGFVPEEALSAQVALWEMTTVVVGVISLAFAGL